MTEILLIVFLIAVFFAYRKDLKDYTSKYSDKTQKAIYITFMVLIALYLLNRLFL
ncbi:MAG: hypothetical protein ACKOXF_07395 [Chitinophagaceae bacterium]